MKVKVVPAAEKLSAVGVCLPAGLSYEQWVAFLGRLVRMHNASSWALGDTLVYGEYSFGRRYRDAVAVTGLSYQTLANLSSVAGKFDLSRRRENLTMTHHAEVAALRPADQDVWLDRAVEGRWSVKRLRDELAVCRQARVVESAPARVQLTRRGATPARTRPAGTATTTVAPAAVSVIQLTCQNTHLVAWQTAAAKAGLELTAWIVAACDAYLAA